MSRSHSLLRGTSRLTSLVLPFTLLACGAPDPSSTIAVKKGAYVRIINLTSLEFDGLLGDRPVTPFSIEGTGAPFVLVPPSMKVISLKSVDKSVEDAVKLTGGETHTFYCIETKAGLKIISTTGDSRFNEDGSASLRIANTLNQSISTSAPQKLVIGAGAASSNFSTPMAAFEVAGFSGAQPFQSPKTNPEPSGAYIAIIYKTSNGIAAKVLRSNPPMDVQGAVQGR